VGKYCSNPKCFKEKNYKAKFSTSLILKKIKLTKTILKKQHKKKKEDNFGKKKYIYIYIYKHVGKVKAKFSTRSISKSFKKTL
jgi:hypothetical protein